MALMDVLEKMQEHLAQLSPGTVVKFGHAAIPENDPPPRVVLAPVDSAFKPPSQRYVTGPGKPRALYTEAQDVVAHCWGADDRKAEAIRNAVIVAGRRTMPPSDFLLTAGGSERKPDKLTHAGVVRLLRFTVNLPVLEPASPSAAVTGIDAGDVAPTSSAP
jgi:hypothetical protein